MASGPQLVDLPAQRTDSEQTVDSPFASGLNTPADVGDHANPFDYAHRKVLGGYGEDTDGGIEKKAPPLETVHGRALGEKTREQDTPRARVPSLNEAALRALAMERGESDASGSSADGESPLLEAGGERAGIYSMPNSSISPALQSASPALPSQDVAPLVAFTAPTDTVGISAGPEASTATITAPDLAAISSTTAVYGADDAVDPFSDPFSDAHEFVDSIMGEESDANTIPDDNGSSNLDVPHASANLADSILDQRPADSATALEDDPFTAPSTSAASRSGSGAHDSFILSNSSVVDSTSSLGIPSADSTASMPEMDSLDFVATLGVAPPAPSMAGPATVAPFESVGLAANSSRNDNGSLGANFSLDGDASFDSTDDYASADEVAYASTNDDDYALSNDCNYALSNDLDYALDYDAAPMPAGFNLSSIYALSIRELALVLLKAVLFLPWCVALGGAIVLAPGWVSALAFSAPEAQGEKKADEAKGMESAKEFVEEKTDAPESVWSSESVAGSRSASEPPAEHADSSGALALPAHLGLYPHVPPGVRRLAHWAEYAVPHVAIFVAAVVGAGYALQGAGTFWEDALVRALVLGGLGVCVVRAGGGLGMGVGRGRGGRAENDGARGGDGARRVGMDDAETVRVVLGAYLMGQELPAMRRVAEGDEGFVWA
ncbi:hypothetical protein HDZ31DRAFT_48036 [Schizophyllum fasciatum]